MIKDGTGGRSFSGIYDDEVLKGLLAGDDPPKAQWRWAACANRKCRQMFRQKADGDLFCTEACDVDANPKFRGDRK